MQEYKEKMHNKFAYLYRDDQGDSVTISLPAGYQQRGVDRLYTIMDS